MGGGPGYGISFSNKRTNSEKRPLFFSRHPPSLDANGRHFIDRPARVFRPILEGLQRNFFKWPTDTDKSEELKIELDYFGLLEREPFAEHVHEPPVVAEKVAAKAEGILEAARGVFVNCSVGT